MKPNRFIFLLFSFLFIITVCNFVFGADSKLSELDTTAVTDTTKLYAVEDGSKQTSALDVKTYLKEEFDTLYSTTGGGQSTTFVFNFNIHNPTSSGAWNIWEVPTYYDSVVITRVSGQVENGINLVGNLTKYDTNGLNPVGTDSTNTFTTTKFVDTAYNTAFWLGGEGIGWNNISTSGGVTNFKGVVQGITY